MSAQSNILVHDILKLSIHTYTQMYAVCIYSENMIFGEAEGV